MTQNSGDEPSKSREEIEEWLVERVMEVTLKELDDIDVSVQLINYGINSIDAAILSGDLEEWLGRELPASIIYQFPTIEALSAHLSGENDDE
jgi:acyl carrier protein